LTNEDLLDLTCPVCNLPVPSSDYTQHIEHCLINADPVSRDFSDHEDEDVDMTEGNQITVLAFQPVKLAQAHFLQKK
jgi:hypothetical protein